METGNSEPSLPPAIPTPEEIADANRAWYDMLLPVQAVMIGPRTIGAEVLKTIEDAKTVSPPSTPRRGVVK